MLYSQCSCCGETFTLAASDDYLFCSEVCEKAHDLFQEEGEKSAACCLPNYQTMSLYDLHKSCAKGSKKAQTEWKRRWETHYPNLIDRKKTEHTEARPNSDLNIPSL